MKKIDAPLDETGRMRVTLNGVDGHPEWFAELVTKLEDIGAIVKRERPPGHDGKLTLIVKVDPERADYAREILASYANDGAFARKQSRKGK